MNKIILGLISKVYKRGNISTAFNCKRYRFDGYELIIYREGNGRIKAEFSNNRIGFIACYYFANISDFKSYLK